MRWTTMAAGAAVLFTTIVLLLGAGAGDAAAATCADYTNQAAAQQAKDTRDADHDGIYCESLPCPCAKPGTHPAARHPTTHRRRHRSARRHHARPRVGPPEPLGDRTKHAGCALRGALPDPACTPGSIFEDATRKVICVSGYTAEVRDVPESVKNEVYAEYGIAHHVRGQYEVDHLVPLEGGGSNSIANLFPQPAAPSGGGEGFHVKDHVENVMHERVCDGSLALRPAQRAIARDWTAFAATLGVAR